MTTSASAHDRVVTMCVQVNFGRGSYRPSSDVPSSSNSSLQDSTEETLCFSSVFTVSVLLGTGPPAEDSLSLIGWCVKVARLLHRAGSGSTQVVLLTILKN
jgi:hypothetical protein